MDKIFFLYGRLGFRLNTPRSTRGFPSQVPSIPKGTEVLRFGTPRTSENLHLLSRPSLLPVQSGFGWSEVQSCGSWRSSAVGVRKSPRSFLFSFAVSDSQMGHVSWDALRGRLNSAAGVPMRNSTLETD